MKPHQPPAIFAMHHWPHDYAAQRGSATDFYNALHPHDQRYCVDAVERIILAAVEVGIELVEGKRNAPKAHPTLHKRASQPRRKTR